MKFDIQKTVLYWIEGAVYDLDVAEAMEVFQWLKMQ
jgi:hypothetical protein